jgi:hypothetical protein
MVRAGRLYRIHRGVYAVGHQRLSREGRWMAAVLACGDGAVLSHVSAGQLWGFLRPFPSLPDVTTPFKGPGRRGIRRHSARLPPDEVEVREGIATTTVCRTLLDLASVLDRHRLEGALAEVEYRKLDDPLGLPRLLERHRGARGSAVLRSLLEDGDFARGVTRSELEDRFLRLLDAAGLPRPERNAPLQLDGAFIEVDCLWRAERVAVELDGRPSHERNRQFDSDRARDRRLSAARWRPVRITWRQLEETPKEVVDDLRALLEAPAGLE